VLATHHSQAPNRSQVVAVVRQLFGGRLVQAKRSFAVVIMLLPAQDARALAKREEGPDKNRTYIVVRPFQSHVASLQLGLNH
jgi:hypothetical protein